MATPSVNDNELLYCPSYPPGYIIFALLPNSLPRSPISKGNPATAPNCIAGG
jgi:hypothetical protein